MAPVAAFSGLPATTSLSELHGPGLRLAFAGVASLPGICCRNSAVQHFYCLMQVVHVLFVRGVKSIDVGNFLSDGIHKYAEVRDRRLCPRRPSFPPGEQAVLDRRGTSKIVRVVTDYVTQQLVQPYDLSLHHACRITMYYEGGNDVT
ncbi:hypothetical protein DYB28_001016 [Aphanomyces astaci]|uniref:Uncharacterized protein n=1 Tax=Aphanomyces astaci TaxID=112090 RepID=A0A9X8H8A7_APHAT|nr:hypothetical protein DYB28_001016 [Aphanomyces astaci]